MVGVLAYFCTLPDAGARRTPAVLPRRFGAVATDLVDNVPFAAARKLGADRVIVVRLHTKWENIRMMRTVAQTADLASDPSVILVQPEMERMAQWTMRDVPRLVTEGRRATMAALDAEPSAR